MLPDCEDQYFWLLKPQDMVRQDQLIMPSTLRNTNFSYLGIEKGNAKLQHFHQDDHPRAIKWIVDTAKVLGELSRNLYLDKHIIMQLSFCSIRLLPLYLIIYNHYWPICTLATIGVLRTGASCCWPLLTTNNTMANHSDHQLATSMLLQLRIFLRTNSPNISQIMDAQNAPEHPKIIHQNTLQLLLSLSLQLQCWVFGAFLCRNVFPASTGKSYHSYHSPKLNNVPGVEKTRRMTRLEFAWLDRSANDGEAPAPSPGEVRERPT